MGTIATQKFSRDSSQRQPVRADRKFVAKTRSLSTVSPGLTLLQRQPGCACGGGCPRCQEQALLQTKLKISEPGDKYEQEADRIADEVMRMPDPTIQRQVEPEEEEEEMVQRKEIANQITPLVQRQVLSEMAEEEEEEEGVIQTKTIENQAAPTTPTQEFSEVGPIVHEVLNSPGQPLDTDTRAFMEPRFGHDFSQVRVHTDTKAAKSAQAVNSLAYTVGHHIVFGSERYTPETSTGRQLLAHELTHVLQQRVSGGTLASLGMGDSNSSHEVEADGIAARSHREPSAANPQRISLDSKPIIRRWAISGNIATAEKKGDELGRLAEKVGANFKDWKCIKPVSMRTAKSSKKPASFDKNYERFVQVGDQFDISNLQATEGETLRIYLFDDSSEKMDADLVKRFYPGSVSSIGADEDIELAANSGSTPIKNFLIFGHSGGGSMWGDASTFDPTDAAFDPEEPKQMFPLAEAGLFPRRCWFTPNTTARSVGCSSEAFGKNFTAKYLRKGATIVTTTASVRPRCSRAALNPATGRCRFYNGLDFATSHLTSGRTLEGPFWSVAAFHSGSFWSTLKGKL